MILSETAKPEFGKDNDVGDGPSYSLAYEELSIYAPTVKLWMLPSALKPFPGDEEIRPARERNG